MRSDKIAELVGFANGGSVRYLFRKNGIACHPKGKRLLACDHSYFDCVDTPEEALWWWMHSPVHRAAILTCAYCEIGVSFTYGAAPYYTYVTAKLATE